MEIYVKRAKHHLNCCICYLQSNDYLFSAYQQSEYLQEETMDLSFIISSYCYGNDCLVSMYG